MFFFLGLPCGVGRLKHHPGLLGQVLKRGGKVPALFLHHEFKNVAAFVALPKAAPGPGVREDYEAGVRELGWKGQKPE